MDFSWLSSWKEKKALLILAANSKANVFTISRFTTDGTMKASPSLCDPSRSLLWCSHLWALLQAGSYLPPYHHVPHSLVGTPHPCLSCPKRLASCGYPGGGTVTCPYCSRSQAQLRGWGETVTPGGCHCCPGWQGAPSHRQQKRELITFPCLISQWFRHLVLTG